MPYRLALIVVALTTSGCATIFSGTTQNVAIRTTPGASYAITNTEGQRIAGGNTSGTHTLQRGAGYFSAQAYKLRINKTGYQGRTIDIDPGLNPWYIANLLLGGLLGMVIIDPITGAMFSLHPDNIDVQLEPLAGTIEVPRAPISPPAVTSLPAGAAQRAIPSRHDYTAWQTAKSDGCHPVRDPAVTHAGQPVEIHTFACGDGREIQLTCESGLGCR